MLNLDKPEIIYDPEIERTNDGKIVLHWTEPCEHEANENEIYYIKYQIVNLDSIVPRGYMPITTVCSAVAFYNFKEFIKNNNMCKVIIISMIPRLED